MQDFAYDHLLAPIMFAAMLLVLAGLEWWKYAHDMKPNPVMYSIVAAMAVSYAAYKVWRNRPKLQQMRMGRDGERVVANYLEWFRTSGCFVFHDVPNGDSNIDHMIIGPKGVFTIETKTLSKPARGRCTLTIESGEILANGKTLDRNPLIQAKAQAGWARTFFREARFDPHVWPVVLFPGWFVMPHDARSVGAWVLEPKALSKFMENEPDRLSREEVKAMGSAMTSHIRATQGLKV